LPHPVKPLGRTSFTNEVAFEATELPIEKVVGLMDDEVGKSVEKKSD
jgi:hypothetical protein